MWALMVTHQLSFDAFHDRKGCIDEIFATWLHIQSKTSIHTYKSCDCTLNFFQSPYHIFNIGKNYDHLEFLAAKLASFYS